MAPLKSNFLFEFRLLVVGVGNNNTWSSREKCYKQLVDFKCTFPVSFCLFVAILYFSTIVLFISVLSFPVLSIPVYSGTISAYLCTILVLFKFILVPSKFILVLFKFILVLSKFIPILFKFILVLNRQKDGTQVGIRSNSFTTVPRSCFHEVV